ncbi:MAG: MMPL family transporter [Planctomycetales bacterium]|nr:MMPL family transporter [Planctomycetales bacterium]
MARRLAQILVQYHRYTLAVAIVFLLGSIPWAQGLRLDWQIDGMFPPGHPLVTSYHNLQERFGGNQMVLAVYRDPQLWDESGVGLQRLEQITEQLAAIDGVQAVLSLSELHRILQTLRNPLQLFNLPSKSRPPLLDPEDDLAQGLAAVFAGYTHQPGSDYVAIACLLDPDAAMAGSGNRSPHAETLRRLKSVITSLPPPAAEGILTGEPVLVSEGFNLIQRDGRRLGVISFCLTVIVLLLCFRSIRWTLIPLSVVVWSLMATQASLAWLGQNLTMVSSTLTAIVTVIGVATTMHLLLKFHQLRRSGLLREAALVETLATMLVPVSWACVTDAVGFLALMTASVGPVRDFGLMMAMGAMGVWAAIVLLVPGLALLGSWDPDPRIPAIDLQVRFLLRRMLDSILVRRRVGLIVLALLASYGLLGSLMMRVETDFTKSFRRTNAIVQGYSIVESELGGAGVWDIMLPVPETLTSQYLSSVMELEDRLRQIVVGTAANQAALTKVLSIADADQATVAASVLSSLPLSMRIEGMRRTMPEFMGALLSPSANSSEATGKKHYQWLRVMLRSRERESAEIKAQLIASVKNTVQEFTHSRTWLAQFENAPPEAEVAGYHVMLGSLVESVLNDQWRCFLAATVGILAVMTIATGSLWLAAVALIPNALPVLLVLGTMGWLGVPVNMGAAMIAAVSLGLSVDSSIHYLMHFQSRRRGGAHSIQALRSAQENVGLAVILATIALVVGLLSLCTSEFIPTVVFGTLASLTMLGGLLGNLVFLPLLVHSTRQQVRAESDAVDTRR